jgi:long-subunit fatty acid transport protein
MRAEIWHIVVHPSQRSRHYDAFTPQARLAIDVQAQRLRSATGNESHTCMIARILFLAMLVAPTALGAGYYVGEFNARSVARGGANLVNPRDPSAMWVNPGALPNATGVQLQLDLNLVFLNNRFVRDCGGVTNGCAPLEDYDVSYGEGRDYTIDGNSRTPPSNDSQTVEASVGRLGVINTPSRFDGETPANNLAGVQPIPRLMANFNFDAIGFPGLAAGLFVVAPSSGDYAYAADGYTRFSLVDRDLLEVLYGVTLAYRFSDWLGVGVSVQAGTSGLTQRVMLSGDINGNEVPGADIEVKVSALSPPTPAAAFGLWVNPMRPFDLDTVIGDIEFGGSLQLARNYRVEGPIEILSVGPAVEALGIQINQDGARAAVEITMPLMLRGGIRYANDRLTDDQFLSIDAELDVVFEQWSSYTHEYLAPENLSFSVAGAPPTALAAIILPKNYQDTLSFRGGGSVGLWQKMVELHGGAFYEQSAIPNAHYGPELVDGDKVGIGTGITAKMWGAALTVAYNYIHVFDRRIGQESQVYAGGVPSPLGEPRTRIAMGTYTANYNMLNIGLTVAFDDMFNFGIHAPQPVPMAVAPTPEAAPVPEVAPTPPAALPTEIAPMPEATPLLEAPIPESAPEPTANSTS